MKPFDEFPSGASEWIPDLSRRDFLQLAGAQLAMMGLVGCTRLPEEEIRTFVQAPVDNAEAEAKFFATSRVSEGQLSGLLIKSFQGRPIKVDGNPLHPFNKGRASTWDQAWILSLYDPHRKTSVQNKDRALSWNDFQTALEHPLLKWKLEQGQGFVILTEKILSPTFAAQIRDLQKRFPKMEWVQHEPLDDGRGLRSAQKIFGLPLRARPRFSEARTVVSFESDFFGSPIFPVASLQDFVQASRSPEGLSLFVAEPTPSLTGVWTKNRLVTRASQISTLAQELAVALRHGTRIFRSAESETWLRQIVEKVQAHPGRSVFLAGPHTSSETQELCHELNSLYGAQALEFEEVTAPAETSIEKLAERMKAGTITGLLILGGNPVLTAPAACGFAEALAKVPFTVNAVIAPNATSKHCLWSLPLAHPLESWSDVQDAGLRSIVQPLIAPLFDGKSEHEILSLFAEEVRSSYEVVRAQWKTDFGSAFEARWDEALRRGFLSVSSKIVKPPKVKPKASGVAALPPIAATSPVATATSNGSGATVPGTDALEILFRPDPILRDGRHAGNPWLQELPQPLTQLTWGNAAWISPDFAKARGIGEGQLLEIQTSAGAFRLPAIFVKGQESNSITVHLGHGRTDAGPVAEGHGQAIEAFWSDRDQPWTPGKIRVLDEHQELARTQPGEMPPPPESKEKRKGAQNPETFLNQKGPAWAMVIDLDRCIGCAACIVACQSENNIPVVGRPAVLRGRHMHWMRVDRYQNAAEAATFVPVPCMHCEKAPCEPVCPVAATVHSSDGLNQMIYNRCVGTRYCSNNCPYKVRRFNFLEWNQKMSEVEKMAKNPEVSVRSRGVMEKCTYCVQRINSAEIRARREKREIRAGEVRTACQDTCPTQAITFGNLNEPQSEVRRLRQDPRHFTLLEELDTRPRTTYLRAGPRGGA